jgi:hypothetical protein
MRPIEQYLAQLGREQRVTQRPRTADDERNEQARQHRLQYRADGQAVMTERAVQRRRGHGGPEPGHDNGQQAGGQRRAGPSRDVGPPSAVPRALRDAVSPPESCQAQ